VYEYRLADGSRGRLEIDVKANTVHTAFRAVPRPKAGRATELRWQSGRWEKRTKTTGWRAC
jgi:hypothetical protein